jgi:hypothetical protein
MGQKWNSWMDPPTASNRFKPLPLQTDKVPLPAPSRSASHRAIPWDGGYFPPSSGHLAPAAPANNASAAKMLSSVGSCSKLTPIATASRRANQSDWPDATPRLEPTSFKPVHHRRPVALSLSMRCNEIVPAIIPAVPLTDPSLDPPPFERLRASTLCP